jgi:hypothetical protein
MEYLGAWGTLIHEKKLRSKISCQTPFNSPGVLHPDLRSICLLRRYRLMDTYFSRISIFYFLFT